MLHKDKKEEEEDDWATIKVKIDFSSFLWCRVSKVCDSICCDISHAFQSNRVLGFLPGMPPTQRETDGATATEDDEEEFLCFSQSLFDAPDS